MTRSLDAGLEAATGALRSADWAKATTLFRAIVSARTVVEEVECEAAGGEACRFEVRVS